MTTQSNQELNQELFTSTVAEVLREEFGNYNYNQALTVDTTARDGESITIYATTVTGRARRAGSNDNESNQINTEVEKGTIPVWAYDQDYTINQEDLRAQKTNTKWNSMQEKLLGIREIAEYTNHDIAMNGGDGYVGLANLGTKVNSAESKVHFDAEATLADNIYDEMIGGVERILSQTNQKRRANTILLPTAAVTALSKKVYSQAPQFSLLESIQKGIASLPTMNGVSDFRILGTDALTTSKDALFYDRSAKTAVFYMPQRLTYFTPVEMSGEYKAKVYWRVAPLGIKDPAGIFRLANVLA